MEDLNQPVTSQWLDAPASHCLAAWFSKCGPWTSNTSITWELASNADSWSPLNRKFWDGAQQSVNRPCRWFLCVFKFESHCWSGMSLSWFPHVFSDGFEAQLLTVFPWPLTYPLDSFTFPGSLVLLPHLYFWELPPKPIQTLFSGFALGTWTQMGWRSTAESWPGVRCFTYIISFNPHGWGNQGPPN